MPKAIILIIEIKMHTFVKVALAWMSNFIVWNARPMENTLRNAKPKMTNIRMNWFAIRPDLRLEAHSGFRQA